MTSVGFGVAAVAVALVVWWRVPWLRSWPPALGLLIATFTVVPPHQIIVLGVGADDALFVLGLGMLLPYALRSRVGVGSAAGRLPYVWPLAIGAGLLVAGTTISAFVNADGLPDTAALLLRGPIRLLLYVVMVVVIVAQLPRERTRTVVARGLAAVGTFEAAFGVLAYTIGLPGGFGLQAAQGNTSLVGEIPGRVTGTLGLSPNFLGALLVLSIPVTLGIALDAATRWHTYVRSLLSRLLGRTATTVNTGAGGWGQLGWALAVVVQTWALVLTYTRSSLAVTLLACAVLVALRGRLRWLAVGAVVLVALLFLTPTFDRIIHDRTDRLALYTSAVRVFLDYPIAGVGPGEQARFTAAAPELYRATPYGVAGNNAHNTVLLAAAENGVLGLLGALVLNLALVAVAVAVIRRARAMSRSANSLRTEPLAIGVAMLAFLLQGMANNLFTVTLTASALVMLLGGCALPWLDRTADEDVAGAGSLASRDLAKMAGNPET
ncbi:O-antigen ligase family protein [Actinopolymorpha sp. B17G11]|uniref:O-antigen ligase family protein n=1 Tax=Actinopolymorpha sp. B17G11 TaxID=3160861 RepID=UPI0032E4C1B1